MKYYIFRLMASVALLSTLFCSCSEDEELTAPHFPEQVTATVAAGDIYTLHIEPNTAWTLSLSTETATYFYLLDEGSKVYKMRGAAGSYDVQIGVADIEEFDTERSCEVSLTLGEGSLQETRTIAILTRGTINRDLQVFAAATFDEELSDFAKDETENYIYGEQPVAAIDLVQNMNDVYIHRIAVEANHPWAFAGEIPAWLTPNVTVADKGRTEVYLRTARTAYPFEDTVAKICFSDMTVEHNPTLTDVELAIAMPGCADYVSLQLGGTLNFNDLGQYNNDGSYVDSGAIGWVHAPMGARVYKVAVENGYCYASEEKTAWFTVTEEFDAEATPEAGIWSRKVTVKPEANTDAAREGMIVVVPQSKASAIKDPDVDLFNADGTALRAEYAAYSSKIQQDAYVNVDELSPIEIASLEALQAYGGDFAVLEENSWIWSEFDTEHAFRMTYPSNDASYGGDLKINKPFDRVEIVGFDGKTLLQTNAYDGTAMGEDKSWVTVQASPYSIATQRRVTCRLGEEFPNTCPGDMGENEAFLLFKDAEGNILALIYFVLDENYKPGGGSDSDSAISFVDASVAAQCGAKLAEIVEGDADYSAEDAAMGVLQFRLTYTKAAASEQVYLNVPDYRMVIPQQDWLSVDEPGNGTIRISMDTESGTGYVNLYNDQWIVFATIVCVADIKADDAYDPNAPVTFVDYEAAQALGAQLFAIPATDDAYDKELGSKGVNQFRLILPKAGSVALRVPNYYFGYQYSGGWLSFTPDWPENGATEVTITMTSTGSSRQSTFLTLYENMSDGTISAQIQCILTNEE